MIVRLYSVYDVVSEEFGQPFACKNDKLALRSFNDFVKNKGLNDDELKIYGIGVFDTDTGSITNSNVYALSEVKEDG